MPRTLSSFAPTKQFRDTIALAGFSLSSLAQEAGLGEDTLTKVLKRNRISGPTAYKIARPVALRLNIDPTTAMRMLCEHLDGTPIAAPTPPKD